MRRQSNEILIGLAHGRCADRERVSTGKGRADMRGLAVPGRLLKCAEMTSPVIASGYSRDQPGLAIHQVLAHGSTKPAMRSP